MCSKFIKTFKANFYIEQFSLLKIIIPRARITINGCHENKQKFTITAPLALTFYTNGRRGCAAKLICQMHTKKKYRKKINRKNSRKKTESDW